MRRKPSCCRAERELERAFILAAFVQPSGRSSVVSLLTCSPPLHPIIIQQLLLGPLELSINLRRVERGRLQKQALD